MILVDVDIIKAIEDGDLAINPYNPENLGVNSYDVRLGDRILTYDVYQMREEVRDDHLVRYLDAKKRNYVIEHCIPKDGLILMPNTLYLGETVEMIDSHNIIPMMDGRSSVGRLGISVHVTAGFGDLGFCGKWTMEITVVHPVKVYSGMRIAQVWWAYPSHKTERRYDGKYQESDGATPSKMEEDREFEHGGC